MKSVSTNTVTGMTETNRAAPLPKWILPTLFLVGLAMRLAGLSHDLHHGSVYHPDTPKQVRAAEQYLRGDFLVVYDHPDYDGYPYFNSLLVSGVARVGMSLQSLWLRHTGAWTGPVPPPDAVSLFWITRMWNAFLSALAVVLCFLVANRFSRRVAWTAALLLLISPMDINASGFAAGDTASAFFALGALWFAFRIMEQGRYRDLAGAAFFVGASFSSKYHGAISVLPVLIGLFLFTRRTGGIGSRAALARWGILAVFMLLSVAVTSPALLIYPSRAFKDIVGFFQYTANFGLSSEVREQALIRRIWLGWKANLPDLIQLTSLPVALAALASLALVRKDPRLWLVLSVVLVHVFIVLGSKPHLHSVHHLPVLAYTFFAAAIAFFHVPGGYELPPWRKVAALGGLLWAGVYLIPITHAEIFFSGQNDTRRVVQQWARHAVPPQATWSKGRYTFRMPVPDQPLPIYFAVRSGDPPDWPDSYSHKLTFSLEDRRLNIFRNRPLHVHVAPNPLLRPPATPPFLAPLPLANGDSLIPLDFPWPGRTPWARDVMPSHPLRAVAVTDTPLARVWMGVTTVSGPAHVTLRFGGHKKRVVLESGAATLLEIDAPTSVRGLRNPRAFYRWRADARWGQARVLLFRDGAAAGIWALLHGDTQRALPLLADEAHRHPLYDAALAVARGITATEQIEPLRAALNDEAAWIDLFGADPKWFDNLPYIEWTQEDWTPARSDEEDHIRWLSPVLYLTPGVYRIDAGGARQQAWTLENDCGGIAAAIHLDESALLTLAHPTGSFRIRLDGSDETAPPSVVIRPDVRAAVQQWIDWLSDPSTRPVRHVAHLPDSPLVRFANGVLLQSVDLCTDQARPGGEIAMRLYWQLPPSIRKPDRDAVWIHLVNEEGSIVAQADHTLLEALSPVPGPDGKSTCVRIMQLPDTLEPGKYELHAGLWIPSQRRRIDVRKSAFPADRRHVVLDTITLAPATELGVRASAVYDGAGESDP